MLNPENTKTWVFPFCPTTPDWSINWTGLLEEFEWLRNLDGCPQDPIYHSEGDVLTHTKLVCTALAKLPIWRELKPTEQSIIFMAALLHDIAKPLSTAIDSNGRVSSAGHARNGAKLARRILWEMNVPFYCREQIVYLARYSSLPFFIFEKQNPEYSIIQASQLVRLDYLSILAQADVLGRKCQDQKELLEKIELFSEFAKEQECFTQARLFPSPHSRFIYFQKEGGDPNYQAFDDTCFEVVLMAGLPASGKDTWIKNNLPNWPVISLDEIRKELKIPPDKNQGQVLTESKERARQFLRQKQSFVWNATNVMSSRRSQLITLFNDYKAHIRLVYLETNLEELFKRNHSRSETVPKQIIEKMIGSLEIPNITEAHKVEWVIS